MLQPGSYTELTVRSTALAMWSRLTARPLGYVRNNMVFDEQKCVCHKLFPKERRVVSDAGGQNNRCLLQPRTLNNA